MSASLAAAPSRESFPPFFDQAPVIDMYDPLAEFLGAVQGGHFRYHYADIVRMAGHSCPTVASSFLLARAALHRLYGDETPIRGDILVEMADPRTAGVAGVVAGVVGFICGATEDTGFGGLGGKFGRRERLFFQRPTAFGAFRLSRLSDPTRGVEALAHLQSVPGDARTSSLMGPCLHGYANPDEIETFRRGWQDRVRRILTEHADDPNVIQIEEVTIQA